MRYIKLVCLLVLCFTCSLAYSQSSEAQKDYWLDKYLSVSFPLRSIRINSFYGIRHDPFTGRTKRHCGLDLRARYEEVLSMFDGVVKSAGHDNRSGYFVILQYGDYTVSYCHLSDIWVQKGQFVFAGDPVGISGSTGRSTGPHLHITARLRGALTDPYNLLLYVRDTRRAAVAALHLDDNMYLTPQQFIRKFAGMAMRQQKKYGIPASVILSQMALESGWGSDFLSQAGNNFFGIKRGGKHGPSIINPRDGVAYRRYEDVRDGIEDHSLLLMSKTYRRCHRFSPLDYHNWLVGIRKSGYCTNTNYVRACEKIIKQYGLHIYDQMAEVM
ncbi:MAG: glucosaminidase domain-containing protein [Prevotella sp.]|nr:glucosaminidase domain-containing protein [Prevotella sp.]